MIDLIETLDVDDDTYPSDARLDEIRSADACHVGAHWMVHTFPLLAAELAPYAWCEVTPGEDILGNPEYVVSFSTGGWSGCEDFIAAVLGNAILNMMYYSAWKRGGHYEFRVPVKAVRA